MKVKRFWSLILRLTVCAALMLWILHSIFLAEGQLAWERQGGDWSVLDRTERRRIAWTHGPEGLWRTIASVPNPALAVSLVFMGSTIVLGIVRWRWVLHAQGLPLSFARASEISLVAHFFNSFLLGSSGGDLIKAYYAARETLHKKTEAITTVFIDRLIGLFAMLLFGGLMMLPNSGLVMSHHNIAAPSAILLAMLVTCGLVMGLAFRSGLSHTWPRARDWLANLPKGEQLQRSLDACRRLGERPAFLLKLLALSMGINLACVLQFLALATGLGIELDTRVLFFIVPAIICIAALPITPSGLGVRENLFVVMLAAPALDVPPTQALSLSLLAYAGSLAWSLVGGLVYIGLKDKHKLDEVTHL